MKTHVFAILDRSGSMANLQSETIGGYNKFVKDLEGQNVAVTLTIFDTDIDVVYADEPIKTVPKLTDEVYFARGMTALVDAMGKTLSENKGKVKPSEKAIVLVITDGQENASKEFKSDDLKKLIQGLDKKKNWTFTYLGANQDAWNVSKQYGFQPGNVSTYNATPAGTAAAFRGMSVNTVSMASSGAMNTAQFYSAEDKEKLENAK